MSPRGAPGWKRPAPRSGSFTLVYPRVAHSRASAGPRLWSWLRITVAPSSRCLATSEGLDPAGVGHVLAGGDVAVAPDQADVAMSRA